MAAFTHQPWVISLKDQFARVPNTPIKRPFLFRVPPYVRSLKPDLFDSKLLSLGLYNRDFTTLNRIDELKIEVVREVLKQLNWLGSSGWNTFCGKVAGGSLEAQALQDMYEDGPKEEFLTPGVVQSVLTLDAVFVSALMSLKHGTRAFDDGPYNLSAIVGIMGRVGEMNLKMCYDEIWLLENQLPLFLIRGVWNIFPGKDKDEFDDLLKRCVRENIWSRHLLGAHSEAFNNISIDGCEHLLGCMHQVLCWNPGSNGDHRTDVSDNESHDEIELDDFSVEIEMTKALPSITELRKSGIHLKRVSTGIRGLKFERSHYFKATLHLPVILVDDHTEMLLLNLCAYEGMKGTDGGLIPYLSFMDDIVDNEDDVHLLREGDDPVIPMNGLGENEQIAILFNTVLQNFYVPWSKDTHDLTAHVQEWYNNGTRRQILRFFARFVDKPWISVSLAAATTLLVLTGLQTVYTILGYKR